MIFWIALGCTSSDSNAPSSSADQNPVITDLNPVVQIEDTFVETVKRISWEGEPEDQLLYVDGMGVARSVNAIQQDGTNTALLFGLHQYTTVQFQIGRTVNEQLERSEAFSVDIGGLESTLPELELTAATEQQHFLSIPVIDESGGGVVIVDGTGEYVWSLPETLNISAGMYTTALFSKDGQSLLIQTNATDANVTSHLYRVSLTGEVLEEIALQGGHLSFAEVAVGHYFALGYQREEQTEDNGEQILSDLIIEIIDGEQTVLWSSYEAFPYETFGGVNNPDWMHINYLAYDSYNDHILLSSAKLEAYIGLTRTGDVDWVLSPHTEYDTVGIAGRLESYNFVAHPHSIHSVSNEEYVVFNRNSNDGCSKVAKINLNENDPHVDWMSSSMSDPCFFVGFLGQALPISDDKTLANWSDKGQLSIWDSEQHALWQLNSALGAAFGFSDYRDTFPY